MLFSPFILFFVFCLFIYLWVNSHIDFLESPGVVVIHTEAGPCRIEEAEADVVRLSEVRRRATVLCVVVDDVGQDLNHNSRRTGQGQVLVLEALLPRHDVARPEGLVLHELLVLLPQVGCCGRAALLCLVCGVVPFGVAVRVITSVAENTSVANKTFVFVSSEVCCVTAVAHCLDVPDVLVWLDVLYFYQSMRV